MKPISPKEALNRLIQGNQRYVKDQLEHPNRTQESREAVKAQQFPFATILGCSDSRVSPEILFDQGIGDLFVVRVAGNVVGPVELDSIDYSALYLGSSLILVLGHENCGAVTAVFTNNAKDIPTVAEKIQPAVEIVQKTENNTLENAVKKNIHLVVKQLKNTPVISKLYKSGKIEVAGAYYHLKNGEVELLEI